MNDPTNPFGWGARLATIWQSAGMSFPIDVPQIAIEYSKRFSDPITKVKGHDVSGIEGMLIKSEAKSGWYILYDETVDIKGRINFTLGHELGHYLLHRQVRDEFRCGQRDVIDYDGPESRRQEIEANKFASYLLMPIDDYRAQIQGHQVTLDLLGHCAERYQASFTAAALKWLEFTEECAMLVVARDDFVCWSRPSTSARKQGVYLPPGAPVPESAIERLQRSNRADVRNRSCRVRPGVWHSNLEADEAAILSDRFDLTIFLIRFPFAAMIEHEEEEIPDALTGLATLASGLGWKK